MSDLKDLYQEVILDHCKAPRNFREMEAPDKSADGRNPLCGDQLTLFVKMDGDKVQDVCFVGNGCAISKASASMMTGAVKGKSIQKVQELFNLFHDMVTARSPAEASAEGLGKLAVFSGVCEFPVRVKCASLSWHTLQAALKDEGTCSTE